MKTHILLLAFFLLGFKIQAQVPNPQFTGPHDEYGNAIFIKVHFNFIVAPPPATPWINYATAVSRAQSSLAYINGVFNQHGIYFISAAGSCNQGIASIFEHDGIGGLQTIRGDLPNSVHLDCLDIYVEDDTDVSGDSNSAPSTFLGVKGTRNPGNILVTETEVLVHEIGHCFGLSHTFSSLPLGCTQNTEGCTSVCDCNGIDPGFCCGDYVDDTEINPISGSTADPSTCAPLFPSGITSATIENFMSYVNPGTCRNKFTPGQVKRMRFYLNNAGSLKQMQPQHTIFNPPTNITTWTSPQTILSNILVLSGQTLYVNATLEMPEGSMIYVEKGGKLIVNALITGACGKMWQGIVVDGTENFQQTQQHQGYVLINSTGIIEHAQTGIRLQGNTATGQPSPSGGGGIVFGSGGKIRNCITGIAFAPYEAGANKAKFFNTEFTVDQNFRGGAEKVTHLKLNGTYGVFLSNAALRDDRTTCSGRNSRAIGIDAFDASFTVTNGCEFDGLDYGVRASTLNLSKGIFSVNNSEFSNCFTGIYSTLASGFRISQNDFNQNRPEVCDNTSEVRLIGVQANAFATNVQINNNNFNNTATDPALEITVGTDCAQLGTANNEVFDNTFNFLEIGNQATGINGGQMGEMSYSGLLYECNLHDFSSEGDFFVPNGQVRIVQGEIIIDPPTTIAAGNTFSGVAYGFRNQGLEIRYFYDDNNPVEDPGDPPYSTGLDKFTSFEANSSCGGLINCPNPPCNETALATVKAQFFQIKQQWLAGMAAFSNLNTPEKKEAARNEISQLRLQLDRSGKDILHSYQSDTLSLKLDSILVWLAHLQTFEADYHRARHYFFAKNFSAAEAILNAIPTKYDLDTELEDAYVRILEVFDILQPHLILASGTIYDLPGVILEDLENYLGACDEASFLAEEILRRNGSFAGEACESGSFRPVQTTTSRLVLSQDQDRIRIFPNPASKSISFQSKTHKITQLQLFDVNGRVLFSIHYPEGELTVQLDVDTFPPGLILANLVLADGSVVPAKITIHP